MAVRFQQLYFVQQFGRLPSVKELDVSSELIGWAFHSDCQENLFSSLLSTEPAWEEMRSMGFGFWYTNITQLRQKVQYGTNLITSTCFSIFSLTVFFLFQF